MREGTEGTEFDTKTRSARRRTKDRSRRAKRGSDEALISTELSGADRALDDSPAFGGDATVAGRHAVTAFVSVDFEPSCQIRAFVSSSCRTTPRAQVLPRGADESVEERRELARAPEVLRVPLHADAELGVGLLDRLDHAVGRRGRRDQAGPDATDGLMVAAVDAAACARRRPTAPSARSSREPGVDVNGVGFGALRLDDAVRERRGDRRGDVLHERAAGGDVEHLRAAADGEERQVGRHRAAGEIDLELVASRLGILDRRVPRRRRRARGRCLRRRSGAGRRSRRRSLRGLSLTSSTRARPPACSTDAT